MCDFVKIQSLDKILIKKANKLYKNLYLFGILVIVIYLINKGDNMKKQRPPPKTQTQTQYLKPHYYLIKRRLYYGQQLCYFERKSYFC